jgi:hypothetical protein
VGLRVKVQSSQLNRVGRIFLVTRTSGLKKPQSGFSWRKGACDICVQETETERERQRERERERKRAHE